MVTSPSRLSIPVYVNIFECAIRGSSAEMPDSALDGFWKAYIDALTMNLASKPTARHSLILTRAHYQSLTPNQ